MADDIKRWTAKRKGAELANMLGHPAVKIGAAHKKNSRLG